MPRLAALAAGFVLLACAESAVAIDLDARWNFGNPAAGERRFRTAVATADGDHVLVLRARDLARSARHDALAVDALRMMAFVDVEPQRQVDWNRRALELALAAQQPGARRWQATLRNNLGLALRDLGRYDETLKLLRAQEALRERAARPAGARIARWQIARTLRTMGRSDEASSMMQLALAQVTEAAGAPDPYLFEELEALYRARGDDERAARFEDRRRALQDRSPGR